MTKVIDFNSIVASGKLLGRYVTETINQMVKVDQRKHATACMVVYWAAENGEFSQANRFYNALKVNDQTALRRWVQKHFTYTEGEGDEQITKNWFTFSNEKVEQGSDDVKGFICKKGTEAKRKGIYTLDELLALDPFFTKDVSKPAVLDLNALLQMLVKAGESAEKKAEKEGLDIPASVLSALKTMTKEAKANIVVANDDSTTRSNVA